MVAGASYFEELHVALVVALVVICVVLGLVGWELHPNSNGFQAVPQNLRVLVAGSGFDATETLHQTSDDSATLIVSQEGGKGYVPDSDTYSTYGGPQGAGAVDLALRSPVTFDRRTLSSGRWSYIVLNPGSAQPCNKSLHYRAGTVTLPLGHETPALVVPPLKPETIDRGHRVSAGPLPAVRLPRPVQPERSLPQCALPTAARCLGRHPVDEDPTDR